MKRFKSTTGEDVRIALLSGHVFLVGSEWKDLPEFAWSDAYAQRCISEDMITGNGSVGVTTEVMAKMDHIALAKEEIKGAILEAMEEGNESFFNKMNGVPKVSAISEKLGKKANQQYVREVWYRIQDETGAVEKAEDNDAS